MKSQKCNKQTMLHGFQK